MLTFSSLVAANEAELRRLTANNAQRERLASLERQALEAEGRLNVLCRPVDELDDRLRETGFSQLTGDDLRLFCHDVGLGHLERFRTPLPHHLFARHNSAQLY